MSEFGDRMRAQRAVLRVVNEATWPEELFGLSKQAIDRWSSSSQLAQDSEVVYLLHSISDRLRFLAHRSQSQVSDEYREAAADIREMSAELRGVIARRVPN